MYLNSDKIPLELLENSIKKVIQKHPEKVCPILIGSALKNRGIQPLLDAIIKFMASPFEKSPLISVLNPQSKRMPKNEEKLCAYAYKVVNDKEKGSLVYMRIYSGRLSQRTPLVNSTKNVLEKIQYIYRVRANQYVCMDKFFFFFKLIFYS